MSSVKHLLDIETSTTIIMSKSYSDAIRSSSARGETRKRGSGLTEAIDIGLTEGGGEVIGDHRMKSLLLANSSSGGNKNLCFVNAALNVLRCIPDFR